MHHAEMYREKKVRAPYIRAAFEGGRMKGAFAFLF